MTKRQAFAKSLREIEEHLIRWERYVAECESSIEGAEMLVRARKVLHDIDLRASQLEGN